MRIYLSLFVLAVSLLVLGCSSDSSDAPESPTNRIKPVLADTTLSVAENSLANQNVGAVTIVNAGDSVITLFTLTGTGSNLFDINASGSIVVAQSDTLDYETVTSYTLSSTATNSAGVSDSVVVVINIEDVNDTSNPDDVDGDGYTVAQGDCDDAVAAVNPGAAEICDGIDNDCDAQIDENTTACDDGFSCTVDTCGGAAGCVHTPNDTICDDQNPCTITQCNPSDQGCDIAGCLLVNNVIDGTVCDDGNPSTEGDICTAGVCAGTVCIDNDSDGACATNDSNDANPNICMDSDSDSCDDCTNGSYDPSNDGLDTDGDGLCNAGDTDDDNDGVIDSSDIASLDPNSCSDLDSDTCDDCSIGTDDFGPLSDSLPNNDGLDTDSDGICNAGDTDDDGDGDPDDTDCAPLDANIYHGASEIVGDNIDQDCDGSLTCYVDSDGDGYGSQSTTTISGATTCQGNGNYVSENNIDCDDTEATINPGAVEIVDDGRDENCDGGELCFLDADSDGYRSNTTVESGDLDCTDMYEGQASDPIDADDTDPNVTTG